jgi:hypothetical protein
MAKELGHDAVHVPHWMQGSSIFFTFSSGFFKVVLSKIRSPIFERFWLK